VIQKIWWLTVIAALSSGVLGASSVTCSFKSSADSGSCYKSAANFSPTNFLDLGSPSDPIDGEGTPNPHNGASTWKVQSKAALVVNVSLGPSAQADYIEPADNTATALAVNSPGTGQIADTLSQTQNSQNSLQTYQGPSEDFQTSSLSVTNPGIGAPMTASTDAFAPVTHQDVSFLIDTWQIDPGFQTETPEPAMALLVGVGLLALALFGKKRIRASR
jgi:hypothetical protein